MEGKRRRAAAALVLVAGAPLVLACGSHNDGGGDAGSADAAVDALEGSTCVQYGDEAYLRMTIAGALDGYFNWASEGVECSGSFDDHSLTWEMPGLHTVTLVVPDMVAHFMADENPAQVQLALSEGSYDTGADGCMVNLIQNFEPDPEGRPGIYRVRGSGECAQAAQPVTPGGPVVNIVGSFVFAGYVPVGE